MQRLLRSPPSNAAREYLNERPTLAALVVPTARRSVYTRLGAAG